MDRIPPKARKADVEIHAEAMIDIGRRLGTSDPARLAAEFYELHGQVPMLPGVDLAELILRGENHG
jgi:hypothetical protein